MLEELDIKALKVEDLTKVKQQIEKMPTASTPAQIQTVFGAVDRISSILHRYGELNDNVQKYFIDNLVYPSVNFTINHKQYPAAEVDRLERYYVSVLEFILSHLDNDHQKLADTFKTIFDPSRLFYQYNSQETETHKFMTRLLNLNGQEYVEWIASVNEGDFVDCIKIDRVNCKSCWSRARVMYRTSTDLSIRFLNEKNRALDRIVSADSAEIMPAKSRTPNYDALLNLKVNDLLDACDQASIWINSTVLQVHESTNEYEEPIVEYTIGYRVYDPSGALEDEETKERFNGWSRQYDETFNATSPKLALLNTMAKKLYKPSSVQTDETIIDDSSDMLYVNEYKQRKFYAVLRPKDSKNATLVRIINHFGWMGGFEKLHDRINQTQNWLPITLLGSYVQGLGTIHAQLFKSFAAEFVPNFKESVANCITKSPESNIRIMTREKLDHTLKGIEALVRRAYSLIEKYQFSEQLQMQIVLVCFNSNFLDKKIQALKYLVDVCKGVGQGYFKYTTLPQLMEWLKQNQLFEQIFNPQTHLELVSRSADLLRFLMTTEGALTATHFDQLWAMLMTEDKELKPIIFKVFQEISIQMRDHQVEYFQGQLSSLKVEQLGSEEVALLFEMNRFQTKNQDLVKRCIEILWNVVKHQSKMEMPEFFGVLQPAVNKVYVKQTAKDIEEKARVHACDLFKNLDSKEDKMKLVDELLGNLQEQQALSSSIKTLSLLIQSFPVRETEKDKVTQAMVVNELVQTRKVVALLMNCITYLKQEVRKQNVPEKDWPIPFQAQYMIKLSERVLLIKILIRLNGRISEIVTLSFLNEIWNEMVLQPLCKQESDMVCKWIKELVEKEKETEFQALYGEFFETTFVPGTEIGLAMHGDGFDTFQMMMCKINEHKRFLKRTEYASGVVSTVNQYGQVTAMSSAPLEEEKLDKPDFEYQVAVHIEALVGIQFLWDLVYRNQKDVVVERSAAFLTKLYLNPTQNQYTQRVQQQSQQFIDTVLENINQSFGKEDFKSLIIRSILLIRNLLNESEKHGIGSLTSLSGLVKGELMTFQITNDLTVGGDVPKKIELKLHSNRTVMEMRIEAAKKIKASWDQIKLVRVNLFNQNREINDTDNGKTLADVRLRNGESLLIQRRQTQPIPLATLTTEDKQLTPVVDRIVRNWFIEFSTNELMSQEQCIEFVFKCTSERCSPEDSRIKDTYDTYDHDRDGYLTLDNFLEFYTSAAVERPSVVWKNLHAYHYRNDLKRVDEVHEVEVDETSLPRFILSNHNSFYDLMFRLFDEASEVGLEVWKLLNRLPTSQSILNMIVNLEGIKDGETRDWSKVFPQTSPYRLLYTLKIIEYLMSDNSEQDLAEDKPEGTEQETSVNPVPESVQKAVPTQLQVTQAMEVEKLTTTQTLWRQDFIAYGGFEQLSQVFKSIVALTHKGQANPVNQQILSFILLVMRNYLAAALKPHVNDIYKIQQYVRQTHYTLEQISTNLRLDLEDLSKIEIEQPKAVEPAPKKTDTLVDLSEIVLPFAMTLSKITKARVKETEEFQSMVERLKGDLGKIILQTLDLQSLYQELIFIITLYLGKEGEIESEERQIAEYGLCLFVSLILYDVEGCQQRFVRDEDLRVHQFIQEGIFTTKNILIRKMFSHVVYLLSKYGLGKVTLACLLKMFPTQFESSTSKRESSQYYDTLCKLIEEYDIVGDPAMGQRLQQLSQQMMGLIEAHVSSERRSSIIFDRSLCGYLGVLESILKLNPAMALGQRRFAQYILRRCLFELDPASKLPAKLPNLLTRDITSKESPQPLVLVEYMPDDYVKCKSSDSRKLAYRILALLVRNDPTVYAEVVRDALTEVITQIPVTNSLNHKPTSEIKSYHGYVGIRNLGCICYMNAMIQQFYMTPAFRYAILLAEDGKSPQMTLQKNRDGTESLVDDNVIHQFQKMFAYLDFSDRPDYNPFKFCFAFKDYTGKPVNVAVQQDAQEFLNMIFDKLETGLGQWKQVIEGVYGGKTCNQMICKGCNYIREKEELFYNLSVQVKGVKHIHESLKSYISGETISDFYCEACEKKNDIVRRQCLSQLPNVLIIHLQRIVFNLDTLQNEKMSNRLEFPALLNLEPYTREGLHIRQDESYVPSDEEKYSSRPKDYYEYKLKGVVVHRGTAVYGHYYSYINHKADKWLEFNDSTIRDFDSRKIPAECYGGKDSEESSDFWAKGDTSSTNAYILVYERNYKQPIKMEFQSSDEKASVLSSFGPQTIETEDLACSIQYESFGKFVKDDFYKEVWLDNHSFMLEKHSYTEEFFAFIRELLNTVEMPADYVKLLPPKPNEAIIIPPYWGIYPNAHLLTDTSNYVTLLENSIYLVTEIAGRAFESQNIKDFVVPIKNLINLVPTQAYSLLQKFIIGRQKRVFEVFITSSESIVRTSIGQIILHLVNVAIAIHDLKLDLSLLTVEDPTNGKLQCEKDIINFFVYVLQQLNGEVAKNWTKLSSYLELIRDFVLSGPVQTKLAFEVQLVSVLIDFFLEKGSPLWAASPEPSPIGMDFGNKKHTMGNKFTNPFFQPLFQCITFMLNQVHPQSYQLSRNDLACLHYPFFYQKAITTIYELQPVVHIVLRMCWDNTDLSLSIAQMLLDGIEKANYESVNPYCQVLVAFVTMADTLMEQRIQWMFGYPQPYFHSSSDTCACPYSLSDASVQYLSTLPSETGTTSSGILSLIYNNRKRYENYTITLLKALLVIANQLNSLTAYLLTLPPPSYLYAKYTDWIAPYIDQYVTESKKYQAGSVSLFNRVSNGEEGQKEWNTFSAKIAQYLPKDLESESVSPQTTTLPSIVPIYILGQTLKSEVVHELPLSEGLSLTCRELTLSLTSSRPMGNTNLVFPTSVLYDNQFIQTSKIDPESSVWKLLLAQRQLGEGIPQPPPLPPIELMLIDQSKIIKRKRQQLQKNKMEEEEKEKDRTDGISFTTEVAPAAGQTTTSTTTTQEQGTQGDMEALSAFSTQLEEIPGKYGNPQGESIAEQVQPDSQPIAPSSTVAIPPAQLTRVDVPIIESQFIRRYHIINTTDNTAYLKFNLEAENPETLNMRLPQQVCKIVKPQTEVHVLSVMKMVAESEWGHYNQSATVMFQDKQELKSTGTAKKSESSVQVYPSEDTMGMVYGPQLPTSQLTGDMDMKQCSQCTLMQSSFNAFCELCGANF